MLSPLHAHILHSQLQSLLQTLADLSDRDSSHPSPFDRLPVDDEDDEDSVPPVPIPVPQSQTPQLSALNLSPEQELRSFGHGSSSGVARTIRASNPPTNLPTSKRFPAPRPLTRIEDARPARAILDLGTGTPGGFVSDQRQRPSQDKVSWARWDHVSTSPSRRLLLIAYPATFQIYDATDLNNLTEVLRVPISAFEQSPDATGPDELLCARVLPWEKSEDVLLGLAFSSGTFLTYSLTTHSVINWRNIGVSIVSFEASRAFVVVSTTTPPSLHVLAAHSLATLHVVPSGQLAAHAPPPTSFVGSSAGNAAGVVSSASAMLASAFGSIVGASAGGDATYLHHQRRASYASYNDSPLQHYGYPHIHNHEEQDNLYDNAREQHQYHQHQHQTYTNMNTNIDKDTNPLNNVLPVPPPQPDPQPIYALHHRLLAYAAPAPAPANPTPPGAGPDPSATAHNVLASDAGNTQPSTSTSTAISVATEAATAARSVWGGMRVLGGLAVSAARSRIASGGGIGGSSAVTETSDVGRLFSRSAPEGREREIARKRLEDAGSTEAEEDRVEGDGKGGGGVVVAVLDLAGCDGQAPPGKVLEFAVGSGSSGVGEKLSRLEWGPDGCSLGAVLKDGSAMQVYNIRPRAQGREEHVYQLRRGRTGAVVEGVAWNGDGRWVALGTRNRTVHLFGVNPYGGKTDVKSHLEGRVRNVYRPQPITTELSPLVRLRAPPPPVSESLPAPLAFTFLAPADTPQHLLPTHPNSTAAISVSPPTQPGDTRRRASPARRPAQFQDILLFDPVDASLTLRRVLLEMRSKEQGVGAGVAGLVGALGGTSISLPGMGMMAIGGTAGSPGAAGRRSNSRSRAAQGQVEAQAELAARESTIMTWSLRKRESGEVRKILRVGGEEKLVEAEVDIEVRGPADWLAQAELSTHSKSPKILPRSIYLSHQFSFHTLGEDYHALIRRYQFDIGGHKIDVRREVQVSAYSGGSNISGESFVEGGYDTRHRTLSSSFDEPLASALSNELEHAHVPGVLPMYPNGGTPSSYSSSPFRSAIPIRSLGIGDGVSESIGRIRRELHKVRSPRLRPRPDSSLSASVPLEFDEEDEDFLARDHEESLALSGSMRAVSRETSRGDGDSGPTLSTPATSARALESEEDLLVGQVMEKVDDAWGAWSAEDKLAVEEVERFDTIDVLGLLDEEQARVRVQRSDAGETRRKSRARRRA
ncbi:hypothetical protein H0H81_010116 [Sphagnurus paluster]|uniref:BCAS3 WD40 domain-containing protein n=1 Tax=Sphagnurus paluster TaxID=117069 RepID=A0A9P7GPG8_9AGAR|nr:hypothetical protein H0H81_010116 [Sphagnurus paluster]